MMKQTYFSKRLNIINLYFIVLFLGSAFLNVTAQTSKEYAVADLIQLETDLAAETYDEYVLTTSGGTYDLSSKLTINDSIAIIGKDGLAVRPVITCSGNNSQYGGIFNVGASLTDNICISLENLEFDQSITEDIGYFIRSQSKIDFVAKNCYIHGNQNANGSLRIQGEETSVTLENTLVSNSGQRFIHFFDVGESYGPVVISNCTFDDIAGPVIYYRSAGSVASGSDATVNHCTFNNIQGGSEGVLKFRDMTGTVTVKNSIFTACEGTIDSLFAKPDYCYVNGLETVPTGTNLIETDPVFADSANINFTLTNWANLTAGDLQILGDLSWYDDTFPPVVYTDLEKVDNTHVKVKFNEMIATAGAETLINYTIGGTFGLSGNPTSASLSENGMNVTLEISDIGTMTSGQTVVVVVENVSDINGNEIEGDSITTYTYFDEVPPTVTMVEQNVKNDAGSVATMQSNETGLVYLILESEAQASLEDFAAAISAGKGNSASVDAAAMDINVSTSGLMPGKYNGYAVDLYENISDTSTNQVTVSDVTAPVVSMESQELTNAANEVGAIVESNENGDVYLILEGEAQATITDFEAAITAMKGTKGSIAFGDTAASLSMSGLSTGLYFAYATDLAGNISTKSTDTLNLIEYVPLVRNYAAEDAAQLSADIVSANDGDIFVLTTSGGAYDMSYWHRVSANITIMADEDLVERPVLSNYIESSTYQNFRLFSEGAGLTLKGLEIDNSGNGSYPLKYMIRVASNIGNYSVVAEDCHFRGEIKSGGAIFIAYGGTHADSLIFRNCIFEDTYAIRMMGLGSEDSPTWDKFEISNCTFMNIADNVIAIKDQPKVNALMPIEIDHCTFFNVTDADEDVLSSDSLTMVSITNSIFAEVPADSSLMIFGDATNQSTVDYFNIFNCEMPIAAGNGVVGTNNWNLDPQFADTANGDLTLGNPTLLTLGSDGLPLGDLRWADVLGPKVLTDVMALSDSTLLLTFSEWIDTTSGENPLNYTLSGSAGLTGNVKKAELLNFRKVVVTTDNFLAEKDKEIIITVSGVEDLKGNEVDASANTATYVVEEFLPVVFVDEQTLTNASDENAIAQGSLTGYLYIVLDGVAQSTVSELDAAVVAYSAAKAECTQGYTDVLVSTYELVPGTYYAYLVDGSDNISEKGGNSITITDGIPPVVSAEVQSAENTAGNEVFVQSSEDNGDVYIMLDGVDQSTNADFITAVALGKGAKSPVNEVDTDVSISTDGLELGIYYAYAIDDAGNISEKGSAPINITEPSSAIDQIAQINMLVKANNNQISLLSYDELVMTNISIYDITGRIVEQDESNSNYFESNTIQSGLYIVQISFNNAISKTIKVLVK